MSLDGLLSHRSSQIPSSLRKFFSGYSDCIDLGENLPLKRVCLCGEISLAALVAALGGFLDGYFFTANPENYFLIPSSRCASRNGLVSATSFKEIWRVMFMDFLKFSMTIRRPSSGMLPSELKTPTEES